MYQSFLPTISYVRSEWLPIHNSMTLEHHTIWLCVACWCRVLSRLCFYTVTQRGLVVQIYIIGAGKGSSPTVQQTIAWIKAVWLWTQSLASNWGEIWIAKYYFLKAMYFKNPCYLVQGKELTCSWPQGPFYLHSLTLIPAWISMRRTTRLKSGWGFSLTNSPLSTARVLIDAVGLCLLRVSEVWRLFAPDLRRWINSFSGSDFNPRLVYKTWYFCYFFSNFDQQF